MDKGNCREVATQDVHGKGC